MRILAGNAAYSNNGPRLTPPSTRFKTIVGMSYTIALQYERGKVVRSRINNQEEMMYTLTTGEKAYFPLNVGEAIDSLTLAPGQPFTVCHHGGGNWDIERAHPSPEQPPQAPHYQPPPQPRPAAPEYHYRSGAGIPREPLPPPAAANNQKMNGAGEDLPAILTRAYANAIEVTLAAVESARAKGLTFLPTHEGLQACAATLFIAETRRQS